MNKIIKVYDAQTIASEKTISGQLPKADSIFHGIRLACLRWKQLNRGADPRIAGQKPKRKNTSIAIEEVRQGLVNCTLETE